MTATRFILFSFSVLFVDIDECMDVTTCDIETSSCVNAVGSFECLCLTGYTSAKNGCKEGMSTLSTKFCYVYTMSIYVPCSVMAIFGREVKYINA